MMIVRPLPEKVPETWNTFRYRMVFPNTRDTGNGTPIPLGALMEKEGRVDGLKNTESKTLISAPSVLIHCSFVDRTVVNSIFY